jgi:hypothetical protein
MVFTVCHPSVHYVDAKGSGRSMLLKHRAVTFIIKAAMLKALNSKWQGGGMCGGH